MNDNLKNLISRETSDRVITAKLSITSEQVSTQEQVWEKLAAFPFNEGWLCLTDQVLPLYYATDLTKIRGRIILSGELANSAESIHIRQAEAGWLITRFRDGEGDDCLKLEEQYISTEEKQSLRLTYQSYWKQLDGTWQPAAARFTGFRKEDAQ